MKGEKIRDFLDRNRVPYNVIYHPTSYSAQMTAHSAHVPGREMVKTVIVKIKGKLTMVVLNANQKVNISLLKNVFATNDVELARESEFTEKFPDCEPGAMPPFGNLYGMEEIISEDLLRDKEIVFDAGTHEELIKMKVSDFKELVRPRIVNFNIRL